MLRQARIPEEVKASEIPQTTIPQANAPFLPYKGIFENAVTVLSQAHTQLAEDTIRDLIAIDNKLTNFEELNKTAPEAEKMSLETDEDYRKYKVKLTQAALKLSVSIKDGTPKEQLKAAHEFLEIGRANTTIWEKAGTFIKSIAGTVIIVGMIGLVCPVAALIAFKLLTSGGVFMNGIVPAVSSVVASTSGKVAIGTCIAANLYPLSKFCNWMKKPTPAQAAANTTENQLNRLSANFPS